MHLKAAVAAGKHIFCEKPVAVDAPGVRSVLATAEEAKKKNLNLVSGLCWRYDLGVCETMKRVLDGAIGEIKSIQETYLAGTLWHRARQPDWTEMEYQLRNWLYFTWLSGDFNTEQHVHSLDKASWAMRDEPPERAWGIGGRQVRERAEVRRRLRSSRRRRTNIPTASTSIPIAVRWPAATATLPTSFVGTKGRADICRTTADRRREPLALHGSRRRNMYDVEHQALFAAIRSGKHDQQRPLHGPQHDVGDSRPDGRLHGQACSRGSRRSTRSRCWPRRRYAFDADPPTLPDKDGRYPIAMPGVTKFV